MDTREENGIVYFKNPVMMNFVDFAYQHFDCDAIATRESAPDLDHTVLLAYASDKKYNLALKKIFIEKYGKEKFIIMGGISEVQAHGIF